MASAQQLLAEQRPAGGDPRAAGEVRTEGGRGTLRMAKACGTGPQTGRGRSSVTRGVARAGVQHGA